MKFNKYYFVLAVLIFIAEVLIAFYVNDRFVRPYLGDALVVVLIYSFMKSFFDLPVFALAMGVLAFAFTVEIFQYVHIVEILGLEKSALARTVMGTAFEWIDLLAYTAGIVSILMIENYLLKNVLWSPAT
jgi:hypothetical protein